MKGFTFVPLFSIFLLFIFLSCTPYKSIPIETYEPKSISIPQDKTSLLLLSNNIDLDSNDLFDYIDGQFPQESLDILEVSIFESIIGFISTVEKSAHFNFIQPGWHNRQFLYKQEIQWTKIQKLCNQYHCDIVIVIDIPLADLSIQPYYENSYVSGSDFVKIDTFFGTNAKYQAAYYLLDPNRKSIIDSITGFNHYFNKTTAESWENALKHLSDSIDIFSDFGYWNGEAYAQRIAPSWRKDSRILYHTGNEEMRQAYQLAIENNWKDAMEIWETLYNKTSYSKIGGYAAYNLAVAHEVTGFLWKARLWAIRSFRMYESIETSEYANLLYERMQYYKQFEE